MKKSISIIMTMFAFLLVACDSASARITLKSDTIYYINSETGSDNNDGSTPATAFKTRQCAWNTVQRKVDLAGYQVTFRLAPGTYTDNFVVRGLMTGQVSEPQFLGDEINPWNVIIHTTGHCWSAFSDAIFRVRGVTVWSEMACGFFSQWRSQINLSHIFFYSCASAHMEATKDGYIFLEGPYQIWGSAQFHTYACSGRIFISGGNNAVCTVYGWPVFDAFAYAILPGGYMQSHTMQWLDADGSSAVVFGQRFRGIQGGSIDSGGNGREYYPGTIEGVVDPPGIYR